MIETIKIFVMILTMNLIVLGVMIFIIKKLLYNDTMNAVNMIKQVEADVRKKEERIRREIEEHEQEFEKKKAEAEENLERQRKESEKEVGAMREQTIAAAKKEGERIIEQARKNEEKYMKQLELQMEEKTVDYAGKVFELVFSEKATAALNNEFVSELLDALQEVDAGSITVDSPNADITTSHPLPDEIKKRLEGLIEEKFGAKVKVEEKVDAKILSGLILKLGSLEIDGSLINRYKEAVSEVKKTT